jgi:GntR family transcriptional regulator
MKEKTLSYKSRPQKRGTLRRKVRDWVLEIIRERELEVGDQIPSEQDLVELLNVSRSTLREGLNLLEQERILQSIHGSGRYLVALPEAISVDITRLQSVTELLEEYQLDHRNKVLSAVEKPAGKEIANKLKIGVGDPIIFIERIRFAGEKPVIYSTDSLPATLATTEWRANDFSGSLLTFLEQQWGIVLDFTHSTIRAVTLKRDLARRIGVAEDIPWIMLEQINYQADGLPLIFSQDYHRGDTIYFHVIRYRR